MFLLKKILAAPILPPAGPVLLALFELWLPGGMNRSRQALNEYLGQLYNRLKEW